MSDFPVAPEHQGAARHGLFSRPDRIADKLYVITPVFNGQRFRSRWSLYEKFRDHVEAAGAELWTVEVAFGDRAFAVTDPCNPRHLQLRTHHDLWTKEAAINAMVARLPRVARYLAWIDADISFVRPDWVGEILHALQRYDFVQPFSEAYDLCPEYGLIQKHLGFAFCHLTGVPHPRPGHTPCYEYGGGKQGGVFQFHPGYAWACRRSAFDAVGGLIDFAILGAGDQHMAKCLVGRGADSVHPRIHPHYRELVLEWQRRAERYILRNIGFVPGAIHHHWHGPKIARRYASRWQVLVGNQFDPLHDIRRDWQGLWSLTVTDERTIALRDEIRAYFAQRQEDAI